MAQGNVDSGAEAKAGVEFSNLNTQSLEQSAESGDPSHTNRLLLPAICGIQREAK